jgi:antirestriction protein ArdC
VAEISSALIGAELGLPVTHLDNHASYIASWIKLLQHDDRALLSAAAKAEAAASYLLAKANPGRADNTDELEDPEGDAPLAIAA